MARAYTGKVQAVILDWAGTTVDYGCIAPSGVFVDLFAAHGVTISDVEAREPMGMAKRDHISAVIYQPAVAERWRAAHGAAPTEADIDTLYAEFGPKQIASLVKHADMIPGVVDALRNLQAQGIKIGTCTGYTRPLMNALAPLTEQQGFHPDAVVTSDEVPKGRPSPLMAYLNAVRLNVWPMAACVKVGDTLVDIEEGLNAGMWVVAVALTGNEIGLSEADVRALPPAEIKARLDAAYAKFRAAGAHFVIDSVAELPDIIDIINARLSRGEQP